MTTKGWIVSAALIALPGVAFSATGKAELRGTTKDAKVTGTIDFEEVKKGLKVTGKVENAPRGSHAIHIHQFGSCADKGDAAGGHYNPADNPHGYVVEKGPSKVHAGDMGNIEIGADGTGRLDLVIPGVKLNSGRFNVAGRAVILHEKKDQFTQPTGDAGGRIACGILMPAEEKAK